MKIKEYQNIENDKAIKLISDLFASSSGKFDYVMMGWQDGDYLEELCKEEGGISEEHLKMFSEMFVNYKKVNLKTLIEKISKIQQTPYLSSANGNYKYYYDMHMWSQNYYLVYNGFLKRLKIKKRNFIDKLLSPTIKPDWQNVKY